MTHTDTYSWAKAPHMKDALRAYGKAYDEMKGAGASENDRHTVGIFAVVLLCSPSPQYENKLAPSPAHLIQDAIGLLDSDDSSARVHDLLTSALELLHGERTFKKDH